ncbi:disulfide bond formation protein B [Rhodophyticola sp. CCM32]|uniref:disulfide bond formation protein B n=1 Tax=Rhodophyticola sp. CCM32 TaxID=2916397 RepID=UPI00107F53B0|nr:disulfide bond formation protein B [Rhodophyticola sp. CCM32]QBY00457.1 disulfide bond formation protein B [Rhodophyticola sp. CCM32]
MTRRSLILLAGLGSAGLLLAAYGFEYIGGLAPCAMCLWQRWPHMAAIALGALGAALPSTLIAVLGGLTMLGNAGLALFHTGVEKDWWEGPQSCTGAAAQDLGAMSAADLLATDTGPRIVLCDQVSWEMVGLSMASWNGLACLALALIWFAAASRNRTIG